MGKFARKNQKELRQEAKKSLRKPRPKSGIVVNEDAAKIDTDAAEFMYDDADQYHQNKTRIQERGFDEADDDNSASEEEVMPVGDDTSDEDSDEDGHDNDEDADLPDRAAWGNKRANFYHTDFVDKDHGRFQGSDAEEAEEEEREAKELQAKLTKELTDDDFGLGELMDLQPTATPMDSETNALDNVEEVHVDVSKLSDFEKRERLKLESPELLDLIADWTRKITELTDAIEPLLTAVSSINTPILTERALLYLKTKQQLILGYCQNIAFYMSLKAKRAAVDNHPVTRRLVDFRRFLLKLDPVDKIYERPIATALALLKDKGDLEQLLRKSDTDSKKRRVTFADTVTESGKSGRKDNSLSKRVKEPVLARLPTKKAASDSDDSEEEMAEPRDTHSKRKLTYQIAKNKGTTPYRKKEYRNPRVKHRMKYRKAQISRKGQVQLHRPEMKKYGGEMTGIRAGVVRSIKFK